MTADPKKAYVSLELSAEAPLIACRFDPAGKFVYASSETRAIYRWELSDAAKYVADKAGAVKPVAFTGHDSWVFDLAVTSDGKTLISAGGDDTLIWWPTASATPQPVRKVKAHEGWIRAVVISPDGKLVASGGNDRVVRLWNTSDGAKVREMPGAERDIYSLLFHPSGQWLLAGDLDGKIRQWEVATGKLVRTLDASALHTFNEGQKVNYGGVRTMTFTPDAKYLAAGGLFKGSNPLGNVQQPLALRFDWESGKSVRNHLVESTSERIWSLKYHPQGFLIGCLGGAKGQLVFWKDDDEMPFHIFALPNTARGMSLHADSNQVATTHFDSKLRITSLVPKG